MSQSTKLGSVGSPIALLFLSALTVTLGACEDPLKSAQVLEEPRVIGVRVATTTDASSVEPGADATFDVLVAGPEGTMVARLAYQFCEAADSDRGVPFCVHPPFAIGSATLDGSTLTLAVPESLPTHARLALLGAACLEGEPTLADDPLDSRCSSGKPALGWSFDVWTQGPDFANRNPDLGELAVTLAGAPVLLVDPHAVTECGSDVPTVAVDATQELRLSLGAGAREPTSASEGAPIETLQLSHFSTRGGFERHYTFIEPAQTLEATITWRASKTVGAVRHYLVVRDGLGGVSFASWDVCVQ